MAALTLDFRKHSGPTPADDMADQIITDCGNFTLDFKQLGLWASPLFLQTLGPWFPNEMQHLLSFENILMMFLFQKWLGSSFPEDVWAWWLLMHWLQLQFTPCEALPSVWIGFAWQYSQAWASLLLVNIFLSNLFLPVNFTFNMLWYSTLWWATPFSNDSLWLTLFVEGVNDRLLDHCQVSSIPHYCGFKEQEIPWIYLHLHLCI